MSNDTMTEIKVYPAEVLDCAMHWPNGQAEQFARARQIPYALLSDGSIAFSKADVETIVAAYPIEAEDAPAPEAGQDENGEDTAPDLEGANPMETEAIRAAGRREEEPPVFRTAHTADDGEAMSELWPATSDL
jgi:hypothetical protein